MKDLRHLNTLEDARDTLHQRAKALAAADAAYDAAYKPPHGGQPDERFGSAYLKSIPGTTGPLKA